MNQLEPANPPRLAHHDSDVPNKLTEVLRQQAAVSAVLRAIANSPHDLQPIFDTIIDSAVHLCRADRCVFRLPEEIGFRLAAHKVIPAVSEIDPLPPKILERSSFTGHLSRSKLPVHIPDLVDET